jgi:ketosteroid isomerase-like protein
MSVIKHVSALGLALSLLAGTARAQVARERRATATTAPPALDARGGESSRLSGLYRIDTADSDALYSVVADASSSLPYREQQRFFIDLAVRLTPPDQFSIEQRGRRISIASSRAPRIDFEADGVAHAERGAGGGRVLTRAVLQGDRLTVSTDGGSEDKFNVSFEPSEGGRKLVVTRRIHAQGLNEPVVIRSVYDRISEVAHWGIYGEPEITAPYDRPVITEAGGKARGAGAVRAPVAESSRVGSSGAASAGMEDISRSLNEWVTATNRRDLAKHLSFYAPQLKAFYLARDVSREEVRKERARAFGSAGSLRVRAAEPETVFVDGGRVAVMRFRKQYESGGGAGGRGRRSGEVIQELRWRRTDRGWKIFSERDVRVLRRD